jgi:tetratricopeptide (TPR) repeat protein
MDRIAAFQSFIAKNPADPFPRYGLAMEHRNRGDGEAAAAAFADLMARFPDYTATYLMAGQNLLALGRRDEAIAVYRTGVEVAGRTGDRHARSEIEDALAQLEDA